MDQLIILGIYLGIKLLWPKLFGTEVSPEMKKKILATDTPEDTLEVLVGPLIAEAANGTLLPGDANDIIVALTNAKTEDDLKSLRKDPNFIDNLFSFFGKIIGGFIGK